MSVSLNLGFWESQPIDLTQIVSESKESFFSFAQRVINKNIELFYEINAREKINFNVFWWRGIYSFTSEIWTFHLNSAGEISSHSIPLKQNSSVQTKMLLINPWNLIKRKAINYSSKAFEKHWKIGLWVKSRICLFFEKELEMKRKTTFLTSTEIHFCEKISEQLQSS